MSPFTSLVDVSSIYVVKRRFWALTLKPLLTLAAGWWIHPETLGPWTSESLARFWGEMGHRWACLFFLPHGEFRRAIVEGLNWLPWKESPLWQGHCTGTRDCFANCEDIVFPIVVILVASVVYLICWLIPVALRQKKK